MNVNEMINATKGISRIKWSIPARNEGITFEFDRAPIMSAGTVRFHCHQGVDIDSVQKNKRKRKKDEMQVLTYFLLQMDLLGTKKACSICLAHLILPEYVRCQESTYFKNW